MDNSWKEIEEMQKQMLITDQELNDFLRPVFFNEEARESFIRKCLKKLKTRRMLLLAQWYTEIADDLEKIRHSRSALKIIFLMILAESVTKMRIRPKKIDSLKAAQEFFKHILPEDKKYIVQTFQRASIAPKFRFSSIIRILYEVRNKAIHDGDYYSFSLLDEDQKEQHKDSTDFGLLTSGQLGKRKRKRGVLIEHALTYEELRDIFRRTAIENIKQVLV